MAPRVASGLDKVAAGQVKQMREAARKARAATSVSSPGAPEAPSSQAHGGSNEQAGEAVPKAAPFVKLRPMNPLATALCQVTSIPTYVRLLGSGGCQWGGGACCQWHL